MRSAQWALQWSAWLVLLFVLGVVVQPALAQDKKKADRPKLPDPEDIGLETEDFVELKCTFYPSTLGKDAVPIILIHGWESRRTELEDLARFLQAEGHAVLVPDLRGHGGSSVRKIAGRDPQTLSPDDLKPIDYKALATADFITLKRELLTRNNAGELNIELLTLIGIDAGSILAVNWAALDWSQPDLPTIKLGHDVKALVLVSPKATHKLLKMQPALNHPAVLRALSVMIVGGANDKAVDTEMKRLENAFKRFHPDPKREPGMGDDEFRQLLLRKKDLYVEYEDTVLQGIRLMGANLNVPQKIAAFIRLRLVDRYESKDLPSWAGDRRKEVLPQ